MSKIFDYFGQNVKQIFLKPTVPFSYNVFREASKKTGTSTRCVANKTKPKHRGWKVQHGWTVQAGNILVTQRSLRFLPGLNVGFGKNGTLYAKVPGRILVTCEKVDFDWEHPWVKRLYNESDRQDTTVYKKYFNVLPEPQHQNFKLIDQI